MNRALTLPVMFAFGIALLTLSASCSKEQSAAVPPELPAVSAAPDADAGAHAADATDAVDRPSDSDDAATVPSAEEPASPDVSGEPLDDHNEMPADSGMAGDLTPFDVPAELFSQMDEPAGDAHRDPARTPDVHFVPTPQEVVDRMLELTKVSKDDVVYDLGCGDGRIVVTAAKKFGCKALGVDIDPQRVEESLKNVQENGVEALVEIREDDIFQLDLTPASVVTLYLLPDLNVRLIPQLEKLKPGTRIVSHAFDMRGVKPDRIETVEVGSGMSHTVYLWTTPLQKQE
ncbi:MAG: methyltransferase domain-containing protein [Patescibacteria group bacterium]|nr:methyltransferase domain-containing protein [Patescibacteria group bacterium]